MNVAYVIAAVLAFGGAAVHGIAGERLVVRRLAAGALPSSPFGGPGVTMLMIRASWHIATVAFASLGAALGACAASPGSTSCAGVGRVAGVAFSGFTALVVGLGLTRGPRTLLRHPAPLLFTAVAVLSWLGAA